MRILVVEDDKVLADGITRSLLQAGYAVDLAESGSRADLSLEQDQYDLVVLDVGLPGIDGFEVLRRLRQRQQSVPVLIISARDSLDDCVHGLDLGADDYLVKPFPLPELKARVRAMLRRSQGKNPQIKHGPLVMDTVGKRARLNGEPVEITPREWGILELLLLRAGKVVSKDQIAQALCGWDEELSSNAVEVYISRLRDKLDPAGVRIRTIRGFGYMLDEIENE